MNNILIDIAPEGTGRARGFINDWDSSKYISDSDEATQQGRSVSPSLCSLYREKVLINTAYQTGHVGLPLGAAGEISEEVQQPLG